MPKTPKRDTDTPMYEIETKRLLFRRMQESDSEALHRIFSNDDAMTYWCVCIYTVKQYKSLTLAQVPTTPHRHFSDHVCHLRYLISRLRQRLLLCALPQVADLAATTHRYDGDDRKRDRVHSTPLILEERNRERGYGGILEKLLGNSAECGEYKGGC